MTFAWKSIIIVNNKIRKRVMQVEKKNIDWGNLNFGYIQTEKRYVSYFKDGSWDEGILTDDANIVLN